MNLSRTLINFVIATNLALAGCGGGGAGGIASTGGGGGIGGTGITSTGTIDGFGSIFVNGVEYETTDSLVSLDGVTSTEDKLRLGMVVTVRGTVNDDGKTGSAEQVLFDDEVQGPVASIEIGLDGDTLLVTVLGVSVIAERTSTVFDDVSFDSLAVGDLVEVSGFVENDQRLRATRIEKKSSFVAGASEVELKGIVSARTDTTFNLNTFVVAYSTADLSEVPGGRAVDGMQVEVHGTLTGNVISASRVEEEDDLTDDFDDDDNISLQGAITNFVDRSNFLVNGIAIDASSAELEPAGLVLANGVVVEVSGLWRGTNLKADNVTSRRGRVELEAEVAAVNASEGTITLQFFTGTVTVQVASTTLLDDETDRADPMKLGDIASGDFLAVEAIRVEDALVASRVRRDEQGDDTLQAQVESFNAGVDITLLGITFSAVTAEFENQDNSALSSQTFFGKLRVGDLVKVKDDKLTDGVADEVEFEQEDALDGEEFDDDSDEDCDREDSGEDDGCPPDEDSETDR